MVNLLFFCRCNSSRNSDRDVTSCFSLADNCSVRSYWDSSPQDARVPSSFCAVLCLYRYASLCLMYGGFSGYKSKKAVAAWCQIARVGAGKRRNSSGPPWWTGARRHPVMCLPRSFSFYHFGPSSLSSPFGVCRRPPAGFLLFIVRSCVAGSQLRSRRALLLAPDARRLLRSSYILLFTVWTLDNYKRDCLVYYCGFSFLRFSSQIGFSRTLSFCMFFFTLLSIRMIVSSFYRAFFRDICCGA